MDAMPASATKIERLLIRIRPAEKREIQRAAKRAEMSMSSFVLAAALTAARNESLPLTLSTPPGVRGWVVRQGVKHKPRPAGRNRGGRGATR